MARALDEMGVPVTLVLDSGVAYCMGRCAGGRSTLCMPPAALGRPGLSSIHPLPSRAVEPVAEPRHNPPYRAAGNGLSVFRWE